MAEQQKKKQSNKQGRNSKKCDKYKKGQRREVNKIRELIRHCNLHKQDKQSIKALEGLISGHYLAFQAAKKMLTTHDWK